MSSRGGHGGPSSIRNRSEHLSDLKDFGNKFNLASAPTVVSIAQDQVSILYVLKLLL
jgi:hypothetical protein